MGTQDGGGGSAFSSSAENVNAALDRAIQLASEPDARKNIFVQFWVERGRKSPHPGLQKPIHLFPFVPELGANDIPDLEREPDKYQSPYLLALAQNKLTRLSSGDCLKSTQGIHKDASVTALHINADICFSIGNLTRISPSTLLREILSLAVHEAAHLGGAEEPEALEWQKDFYKYFGERFGEISGNKTYEMTLRGIEEARVLISRAEELAVLKPDNPNIFEIVGKFIGKLSSLPDFQDPLALELKLRPDRPTLIPTYSTSVSALIQKARLFFDEATILKTHLPIGIEMDFSSKGSIMPNLIQLSRDLNQVNENFLAFMDASSVARSKCITSDREQSLPTTLLRGAHFKNETPLLDPNCDLKTKTSRD